MTNVTYRDGVAILQVICYVPCLLLAVLLCVRHGFGKSSGWVLLVTFSLLRLIGAICELVAINSPSTGVITAAIICTSIGLSPLSLLCLGLLARVNTFAPNPIPTILFRAIGILSIVGIALGIDGGVNSTHSATYFVLNPESEAAIIIFTATFVVVFLIFCFLVVQTRSIQHGEKRLLLAVALSSPFLAVRLIYALISDFAQNPNFNSYFGNVTIYLCMAVLEEIIVVIICIAIGLTVRQIPKDEAAAVESQQVPMKGGLNSNASNGYAAPVIAEDGNGNYVQPNNNPYVARPTRSRRRGGPIRMLYGYGRDYYESRKTQGA